MTGLYLSIDFGNSPSTDDGSRPYTGTTPLWNNASLFLTGGANQTQTTVGVDTTIRVRVSNASRETIQDVNVDAYVMNPFVGAFDPNHAVVRVKGFRTQITPGSGSSSPTDAHVVPCLMSTPAGDVPWKPTQAQFDASGGHLCLVANCYADGDGGPLPDAQIFDVGSDPHQGQRNISLLTGVREETRMAMGFDVMAGPEEEETALDLHHLAGRFEVQGADRWLLQSHDDIVAAEDAPFGLAIPGRKGRPAVPLTLTRERIAGLVEIEGVGSADLGELAQTTAKIFDQEGPHEGEWGEGRLVLPGARRPSAATVALKGLDAPGSVQAFEFVQRTVGGRVLGGLRVLAVQF